ncbi:MAG TPA: YezD family protein [Methylotenera sp.]|nr:YezD family protein [Methylotenera sp.]
MSIAPTLISTNSNAASTTKREVSQEILRAVEELQQGSGFGSIEIILHEGRVTQIEKREKFRFNQHSNQENQKETQSKETHKLNPTVKAAGK